jgi:hypothetical protein
VAKTDKRSSVRFLPGIISGSLSIQFSMSAIAALQVILLLSSSSCPAREASDMVFDERGLPWTIRVSLGWTIILALLSAGFLAVPLGFYLAYWVRTRRGRSAAFGCYFTFAAILILGLLLPNELPRQISPVATLALVVLWAGVLFLFVAAPLVLRAEIRSIYRRSWGMDLPINPLLTVLFSSIYLNYSVPDLPVPPAATTASRESKPA